MFTVNGHNKPKPREGRKPLPDPSEYLCLIRAKTSSKKLSTVVSRLSIPDNTNTKVFTLKMIFFRNIDFWQFNANIINFLCLRITRFLGRLLTFSQSIYFQHRREVVCMENKFSSVMTGNCSDSQGSVLGLSFFNC